MKKLWVAALLLLCMMAFLLDPNVATDPMSSTKHSMIQHIHMHANKHIEKH